MPERIVIDCLAGDAASNMLNTIVQRSPAPHG
jgi:hypothetical protein